MKVKETPTHYILDPTNHNITTTMVDFLTVAVRAIPHNKPCAFDLGSVETCSNSLFVMFKRFSKEYKLSIINANDKILSSLYLMKFDKFVQIYSNDVDLVNNSHEVLNRRFSIVCA